MRLALLPSLFFSPPPPASLIGCVYLVQGERVANCFYGASERVAEYKGTCEPLANINTSAQIRSYDLLYTAFKDDAVNPERGERYRYSVPQPGAEGSRR